MAVILGHILSRSAGCLFFVLIFASTASSSFVINYMQNHMVQIPSVTSETQQVLNKYLRFAWFLCFVFFQCNFEHYFMLDLSLYRTFYLCMEIIDSFSSGFSSSISQWFSTFPFLPASLLKFVITPTAIYFILPAWCAACFVFY